MVVPQAHYCDVGDGNVVHYHEAGDGPPVLFLHGSGPGASGWSNFNGNYPEIAARGFRTLVPDALGFGWSSKPTDATYAVTWLNDAVRRFLDSLGVDRCAIVGNSMGGAMAIRFALDFPERVSQLVLMAPGGLESRETYMQMAGIQGMMRTVFSRQGYTPENIRALFSLQLYDPSLITEALVEERLEIARLQPRRVFETLNVPDMSGEVEGLQMPVFALWGREDQFCPVSGAATLARACPDARVLTLTRCGHWVMVERRALFNRWCGDFLEGAI